MAALATGCGQFLQLPGSARTVIGDGLSLIEATYLQPGLPLDTSSVIIPQLWSGLSRWAQTAVEEEQPLQSMAAEGPQSLGLLQRGMRVTIGFAAALVKDPGPQVLGCCSTARGPQVSGCRRTAWGRSSSVNVCHLSSAGPLLTSPPTVYRISSPLLNCSRPAFPSELQPSSCMPRQPVHTQERREKRAAGSLGEKPDVGCMACYAKWKT